ncbi:unnamed protein product [Rotaria sp. Silwood2]|nr:unnamed protein product [Rotaria sp. Silwood2]CAF2891248.1 unnamed protein product [Rotaria sp. Silwood2]CAF4482704.1 unnamed protein product [Rotaria sp. Silwood2]CAF4676312.1 unnamed protein product [Rotaria sp. Silwood2]
MALRRCVEHLSSSFSKEQSTYATWIRSHAQHREQARMNRAEQEREQKVNQNRWRWTFQRSHDREQMRHQLPIIKIHSSNKEYMTTTNGVDVDDDSFDADDDRYDTLVLPSDVQKVIDQVRLLFS